MKRVLVAALLGGLTLFAWESLAHLLLPLGQAGIKTLNNEQAIPSSLKDNLKEGGLYFFPAAAATGQAPPGPSGILSIQPNSSMTMMPSQLLTQLEADIVAMVLAGILLSQAGAFAGFWRRVLFFTTLGILPALRTDLSYWNWYGFSSGQYGIPIRGQHCRVLRGGASAGEADRDGYRTGCDGGAGDGVRGLSPSFISGTKRAARW